MKLKIFSRTKSPGVKLSVTTKIAIALSLLISFLMAAVGASVFCGTRRFSKRVWRKRAGIPCTSPLVYQIPVF